MRRRVARATRVCCEYGRSARWKRSLHHSDCKACQGNEGQQQDQGKPGPAGEADTNDGGENTSRDTPELGLEANAASTENENGYDTKHERAGRLQQALDSL